MATLQAGDIADLVNVTLKELNRMRFEEIATDLQEHVAMNQILRDDRIGVSSGYALQWTVMLDHSDAAKMTGLFEVDNVNVADVTQIATAPWRHLTTNYAIERREIAMNRTPARIVELIKIRRTDAMVALADLLETQFWAQTTPDDSLSIFGAAYWMTRSATTGFNGGNPTNYSSGAGGISSTTYARWKNYTYQYTNVTKTDLIRGWRRAATFTNFRSPVPHPSLNTGDRYGYYTNYSVLGPLEEALEAQNDNLGNDIASKDGRVMFRGNPVVWVPQLENDTQSPVYGINWGVFKPTFLEGEYLREEGPAKASNQHSVFQVHVDSSLNVQCFNRRRLFVLATS